MMRKINFTKMVGSGNDFVVIDATKPQSFKAAKLSSLARSMCNRKYGAGADGLLLLEKSRPADVKMRIFNADGSEAEMCGNGARCAALYYSLMASSGSSSLCIETKAGIIESKVSGDNIKIRLTEPKGIKLDVPIKVGPRTIKVNFINTGVPHVVVFTEGLDKIDVAGIAPLIRYHKRFAPKGTNVNFIEALSGNSFKIRTYERGVEDETLACGTGTVASSLVFSLKTGINEAVTARTKSGETLKVYYDKSGCSFRNVWLEGKARVVYKGEYFIQEVKYV